MGVLHAWEITHKKISRGDTNTTTIVNTRKKSWWELLYTLEKLETGISSVYDQKHIHLIEYLGVSYADDEPDQS